MLFCSSEHCKEPWNILGNTLESHSDASMSRSSIPRYLLEQNRKLLKELSQVVEENHRLREEIIQDKHPYQGHCEEKNGGTDGN